MTDLCESQGCLTAEPDGDHVVLRSTVTGESMRCTADEWQVHLAHIEALTAADRRLFAEVFAWRDRWPADASGFALDADLPLIAAVDARRALDSGEGQLPPIEHVEDCTTCLTAIHDNDEWRSLEGLLGECRLLLDRLARDAVSDNLRRVSGDLAQRIAAEVGTGQDASVPLVTDWDMPAQVVQLRCLENVERCATEGCTNAKTGWGVCDPVEAAS